MNFVSRAEWGARPATSTPTAIHSEGTTGHWEGGGIWGGTIGSHTSCASKVRAIQAYHMDHQGWTDIAYNAVACPHGYVFEGRGPGKRSAANGTNVANGRSAVVCYLGGVGDPFPLEAKQAMMDAAGYLSAWLIWGHRDWYSTQCPGDEIWNWIHNGCIMPTPTPVPPQNEEEDMAPTQCVDSQGNEWYFIVGQDGQMWSWDSVSKKWNPLGGLWTSGLSAKLQSNGTIQVVGRGTDSRLWKHTISPPGSPTPGAPPTSSYIPDGLIK